MQSYHSAIRRRYFRQGIGTLICCYGLLSFTHASTPAVTTTTSATVEPDSTSLAPLSNAAVSSRTMDLHEDETTNSVVNTQPLAQAMGGSIYWGEVGDRGGLTVAQVTKLAMEANPNLATYETNRAMAQAELVRARQYPNPTVEAEFGSARGRQPDSDGDRNDRSIYSVSLMQPIELPGKRQARQLEAMAGFPVVEAQRLEYLVSLRSDVAEAYYTVQYHTALERLYGSQLAIARQMASIAQTRLEVGEAGRMEILNTNVEVLKAERETNAARRRKLAARAALDALVGGNLGTGYRLAEDFRQSQIPSLDAAVQAALQTHPRLIRLARQLEQRYKSISRAKSEWWPNLQLGISQAREFDASTVAGSVGMEIPLWSRNQGGIATAEAEAQQTYNDIIIALTQIRRDVTVAWQTLELAREQIRSYNSGIRSASENAVALAYEQYSLGALSFFDVLIARRNLQEAQLGYVQALYDANVAQARLTQAIGQSPSAPASHSSKKSKTHPYPAR